MKLEENNYTDKNGVVRTTYMVKKLNEYGNGITVDNKIEFELQFPPLIREIKFIDKQGKDKTFDSVNIIAKTNAKFENVVLSGIYESANFQIPPNYSQWIKNCQQGDVITVWLRSFKVQEDNKEVTKSTWDCLINGVSPKKQEEKPKMTFGKKEPIIPEVVAEMHKEVGINVPAELSQWLNTLKDNKEEFKGAFSNHYDGFVAWIRSAPDCGTDYYVNKSDVEIQALYKELMLKL